MEKSLKLADWNEIKLYRPFVNLTKEELVRHGLELGVPFEKLGPAMQVEIFTVVNVEHAWKGKKPLNWLVFLTQQIIIKLLNDNL